MYRTHNCGELRLTHLNQKVVLSGWVRRVRNAGGIIWIDLRDRYGITQLIMEEQYTTPELIQVAKSLGREFVIQTEGLVIERTSKNPKIPTGDVEVKVSKIKILNESKLPPFLIEDETDGGEELRMQYRYLDLRRSVVQQNLIMRHKVAQEVRAYMNSQAFLEIETPVLLKSTPEGARDFVVPSRMHAGEFYALPQSPQILKQLLMVSGYDRYYQIVKCFRDEDLRADRQPEFTQIDCEMSFVSQDDVLTMFEGLIKHVFKAIKQVDLPNFQRMTFADAMQNYGSDKPDLRFGMSFKYLTELAKNKGFKVFDEAEAIVGISVDGGAEFTRKQTDELTLFVQRPQVGAKGLVWVRYATDGTLKSSVDKFFTTEQLKEWAGLFGAKPGDMLLILAGGLNSTRKALCELRLEVGNRLNLRSKDVFKPLWVVDFPMFDVDEETGACASMHHPFTSPLWEDFDKIETEPASVRSSGYDMVMNGVELGGGSIRIHSKEVQRKIFRILGLSEEELQMQFGFLLEALDYGAPPHGGIAFGLDRLCTMLGGLDSIREFIAFPKNNAGRDVMMQSPSLLSDAQLKELYLRIEAEKVSK